MYDKLKIQIIFFLFIFFCNCYNDQDIKKNLFSFSLEMKVDSNYLLQKILLQNEIISLFENSIKNKNIDIAELDYVKNYITSIYNNSNNTLPIIVDDSGKIIFHKDHNIINTNLNSYADYTAGLKRIFNNNMIIFQYKTRDNRKKNMMEYHVSSYYIQEIKIRIVIISPIFL